MWFLRANHIKLPFIKLRFWLKKPRLRLVLSTHFYGGVGGTEKLVQAVVDAMPDCEWHILADEMRVTGFVPRCWNHYINLKPSRTRDYDAYLYFCGGGRPPDMGSRYRFKTRLIDTNAARIFDIEDHFDHVLIQSEIWPNFSANENKIVRAFPDVRTTLPKRRKAVSGLPERYLITVFNPFSKAQKGQEVLFRQAPSSKLPIVWCYNDASGWDFSHIPATANVMHLRNLSQEELYYVYEHATAYVSFAYYESYGWTLAEAYTLGLPIIARETGLMGYIKNEPGVYLYSSESELSTHLARKDFPRPSREDHFFTDNSYAKVIARIVAKSVSE
jgi:glycosyltransferase involved in cell wall biosynthesis